MESRVAEREVPPGAEVYGIVAEFLEADDVVRAAGRVHDAGYRKIDAYTPFPVEGLSEALGFRDQWIPLIMLIGGILGCAGGFFLIFYCVALSLPLNIGGRPLFSWPMYIPVTFEMTVLVSAVTGVLGMFLLNGLPMPYHPVFDAERFDLASSTRFFLCIEAEDPQFDRDRTRDFMHQLGAVNVSEVELRK